MTVGLYNYKSYGDAVCYETYYIEKLADYFTTDNTARYACFNDLNSVEGFPSSPIRDNNYIIYKNKGIINLPLSKIEEALNAEHAGAITIGVNVFYFNKYLHQKEDGEIVETTTYDDGYQK